MGPDTAQGTPEPEDQSSDVFSDTLTDEEKSYYETRGESGDVPAEPSETAEPPSDPPAAEKPAEAQDDQEEDLTIEIDEEGKARNAKTGRFVPHAALHKERERSKTYRDQLEAERIDRARVEARIEALNQVYFDGKQPGQPGVPNAPGQAPDQPDEMPDPEEDIFGALKWQQRRIEALQGKLTETQTETKQTFEHQQLQQAYVQDAVQFSKQNDDFPTAYTFVKDQLNKELEAQGYSDAKQREDYIRQQEGALVTQALQQGKSPAEMIYNIAKSRGFSRPAPQPGLADGGKPSEANREKLAAAKAAQNASASLSGRGGKPANEGLTYEALANMSEDEMWEFSQKNPAAFKRAMQGDL